MRLREGDRARTLVPVDWRLTLVVIAVAAAAAIRWRPRPGDGPPPDSGTAPAPVPHPLADTELRDVFERVTMENAARTEALLDARLRVIVQRAVPVRVLRPSPEAGTMRIGFADGTVLLCRGTGHGDLGRLLIATKAQSVRLRAFQPAEQGMRLDFAWVPAHHASVVAVGLDQPD